MSASPASLSLKEQALLCLIDRACKNTGQSHVALEECDLKRDQWYAYSMIPLDLKDHGGIELDLFSLNCNDLLANLDTKYAITDFGQKSLQEAMARREAEMVHHWYHSDPCHALMDKLYEDIIPVLAGRPLKLEGLALYNMLSPEHATVLALVFDRQLNLAKMNGTPFRFMNMGCGVGGVSDLLCERESFKTFEGETTYYLAEKDPILVETMQHKYQDRPHTKVMLAGADAHLPTNLQLIMAIDMLYFVRSQADKAAFILKLFNCLAPGGRLFFNMGTSVVPPENILGSRLPADDPTSPLAMVIKTFQDIPSECRMAVYPEPYWKRWEKFQSDFASTPPSEDWVVEATRAEVSQLMERRAQPGIKGGRWAITIERSQRIEEPTLG